MINVILRTTAIEPNVDNNNIDVTLTQEIIQVELTGAKGADGQDYTPYTHTQSVASTTWTINHNKGYRPNVDLLTDGGVSFEAEITHISVNQVVVTLNSAITGLAILT